MPERDELHEEFADLWTGSRVRIEAAVDQVARAVDALEAGALDDETRDAAERAAHKLVGTLGSYGLVATSTTARELEHAFAERPSAGSAPQLRARADALAERVREVEAPER